MLDHAFEDHFDAIEREAVDALSEYAAFEFHRGDDRTEAHPDSFDPGAPISTPWDNHKEAA